MQAWLRDIQTVVDEIDRHIACRDDEGLTLTALARRLGYSPFHTTRKFRQMAGMSLRDYLRLRKLAFALIEVRDSDRRMLDIALDYGFSSQEAFTRAFRRTYGMPPAAYRRAPMPVLLRTKIHTFDRYTMGRGEIGMMISNKDVKVYFVTIPAHTLLYIANEHSDGYFDFWEKQAAIPGQDCDTICALMDTIHGKLDGKDGVVGAYSGQIMAYLFGDIGKTAEAYGVRLPADYAGPVPAPLSRLFVPAGEYIVFEHGAFHYDAESEAVGEALAQAMDAFDYAASPYAPDETCGRVGYFFFDPEQFEKRVIPVRKK